ncbi:MAG TPA: L,D-transpeptidase [Bdellovibrio sp.]|nr:L,D-transpeptidase [Bdellovibrio sp.]
MAKKHQITSLVAALFFLCASPVKAQSTEKSTQIPDMIEDLDPSDPNIEQSLQYYDKIYEEETGKPAHINTFLDDIIGMGGCFHASCPVWIQVVKSSQRAYLYLDGSLSRSWLVSTGMEGYTTPDFDKHPDGRIYDAYTSTKYPNGDYNGLGNMPYAVFISGGYALHGTPQGNWHKLGTRASHGCIRMHPDNAFYFNRLVRAQGIRNVWITVQ